ncbi:MAG: Cache 3/Cache 2 fusion domain-containing protein [Deltaproteobacteria bacterium]|nr:Cache 3/Cache 2 fusion domain-containing protein [Deltaproteobacteria bacterium]
MRIPLFRDWKIRTKLVSVTLFVVLVPLLCVAFLSMDRFGKALRTASDADLGHLIRNIYGMCKVHQEQVQNKVISDLKVARELLSLQPSELDTASKGERRIDAMDQATGKVYSTRTAIWKVGDNHFVDRVRALLGGTCTIFQRIEGDRLLRVSTNVGERNGKRAVGTFIPSNSPITKAILAGRPFRGRVQVMGNWYIKAYEPIRGADGKVIGALSVGVRQQSSQFLNEEIKGIRVGETGYVYIIDSKGFLKIHPAREGENILDLKDSAGFSYIHAMITDALSLGNGEVGTIRYPWMNPELGDKRPRQKINKYIYFKPWDWIIVAGTYEDEIYHALHTTERFILFMAIAALVLVFVLAFTLSKVLTRPIRELTEVTTKMVGGDLSQRVIIRSADEIGVLGLSFNRMIVQLEDYTSNLENMVEERTRELKESKEKYRDISRFLNNVLDSATVYAIMALDFYGNIIEFNRGAERLFGWKKDEVLNTQNIDITILPEDREKGIQKEMSKRTRAEGVCELEMVRVRKNGDRFPAHTTITAIKDPDGRATGFVEIVRDITLRRSLEKELRETKEFLENVMESSVDGILTTDLKGNITYLNRAMEEIMEHPKDEVLGTHISRFYVKGIEQAREVMALLQSKERAANYEMQVKRKDGEVLTILTSLFLLRDGEADVIGTAGIFKDITEQKLLEAELKTTQARLVEASKMRALGELVAGVAHELNNPLMASQTILHVIFKNLSEDFPERERLEIIRRCNDRIEKIVEHLREFSRQTQPDFKEIDINQTVENALIITGQQLLNHNIAIVRKLTHDLPKVVGDSNQLEQVFLNLISNARDALDDVTGTKELTIHSFLSDREGAPFVVVSVKDTGVGIPEEHLSKVLEPFFSTKPVGKGTGLGLSLCFGIMEAHGGRLEIKSQQGKGTEVKVLLPPKGSGKE